LTFSGLAVLVMLDKFLMLEWAFEMNKETLLNLKKTLNFAEAGLELQHLSLLEKEMYYGVLEIADHNNEFSSDLLKDTVKMLDIPHATYHRVVRSLLQKGFITKANDRKRNAYVLIKTI
jgi:uncharacterized protein YutE (UPF0331/DUF86 family)